MSSYYLKDFKPIQDGYDPDDVRSRRSRGLLEADIDMVCRMVLRGEIELSEGKFLTPYFLGKILKEQDALEKQPSTGPIAKLLFKWEKAGYAICRRNPHAFTSYTEPGLSLGLEEFFSKLKTES